MKKLMEWKHFSFNSEGNTGISLTDGSTNYGFIGGGNALKSGGSAIFI